MAKRIAATVFLIMAVLTTYQAKAQSMHFSLASNGSKKVENTYMWAITANCAIQSKSDKSVIRVSMLKNKGSVNGKTLTPGNGTSLTMYAHESLTVTAEPGATVNVTNTGDKPIEAACSA